jgi:hypothetical protein
LGAGLVDFISKEELRNMPDQAALELERVEHEKLNKQDKAGTSFDPDLEWHTTPM